MRKSTQKGFTLVEVLASIVIISVILVGVAQLMLFTNKTAVSNNSKLVTTHLAKATMERIKIEPEAYFPFSNVTSEKKEYTKNNCHPTEDRKSTRLNSNHVAISYAVFC